MKRNVVFLILAIASGIIGFGDDLLSTFSSGSLLCAPTFLNRLVCGMAKLVCVVFFLLFVISLLFGKNLSSRRY